MRYPVPADTAAVLTTRALQNHNLGLALDRLLPINEEQNAAGEPWKNPDDQWKLTDRTKRRDYAPLSLGVPIPTLISRIRARRNAMFAGMPGFIIETFTAEPDYRLVLGFGAEHVLETNLYLHRIYGFPIIPGSAVKGLTRARAYWALAESLGVPAVAPDEATRRKAAKAKTPLQLLEQLLTVSEQKQQHDTLITLQCDPLCSNATVLQALDVAAWLTIAADFYHVFGTTQHQGQVIFFDAYRHRRPDWRLISSIRTTAGTTAARLHRPITLTQYPHTF